MLWCMRTTLRINDQLIAEARKFAAEKDQTLTAVIEDGLREMISRRRKPQRRSKLRLATFGAKGLQPGVDLDDTASLLDRMEPSDGAD
jgi:hypothetical protein